MLVPSMSVQPDVAQFAAESSLVCSQFCSSLSVRHFSVYQLDIAMRGLKIVAPTSKVTPAPKLAVEYDEEDLQDVSSPPANASKGTAGCADAAVSLSSEIACLTTVASAVTPGPVSTWAKASKILLGDTRFEWWRGEEEYLLPIHKGKAWHAAKVFLNRCESDGKPPPFFRCCACNWMGFEDLNATRVCPQCGERDRMRPCACDWGGCTDGTEDYVDNCPACRAQDQR